MPHPLAGKPAPEELLIDPARLESAYYSIEPDAGNPLQLVSFGTSGHRGAPLNGTSFIDCLRAFQADPETDAIVRLGAIGGTDEPNAATFEKDPDKFSSTT